MAKRSCLTAARLSISHAILRGREVAYQPVQRRRPIALSVTSCFHVFRVSVVATTHVCLFFISGAAPCLRPSGRVHHPGAGALVRASPGALFSRPLGISVKGYALAMNLEKAVKKARKFSFSGIPESLSGAVLAEGCGSPRTQRASGEKPTPPEKALEMGSRGAREAGGTFSTRRTGGACSSSLQAMDAAGKDERSSTSCPRQPQGAARGRQSGRLPRGARPRLPLRRCGKKQLPREGPDRHLQPFLLRRRPRREGSPGASRRKQASTAIDQEEHLGEPLPRHPELRTVSREQRRCRPAILPPRLARGEQKRRFLERIENPDKNWKFSAGDVTERASWKDYMRAYEEMIQETATEASPWYVVPAD